MQLSFKNVILMYVYLRIKRTNLVLGKEKK